MFFSVFSFHTLLCCKISLPFLSINIALLQQCVPETETNQNLFDWKQSKLFVFVTVNIFVREKENVCFNCCSQFLFCRFLHFKLPPKTNIGSHPSCVSFTQFPCEVKEAIFPLKYSLQEFQNPETSLQFCGFRSTIEFC